MDISINWITEFFNYLMDGLAALFNWIMEQLFTALASALSLIPVPDWLANAGASIQSLFNVFGWGMGIIQAEFGLTVIFTALIIRFTIRRLPFIG